MKVYCGECEHYQGSEKVPNPKSAFHGHAWRVKCAIGKSKTYIGDSTTLPDSHYQCSFYVPNKEIREAKREVKRILAPTERAKEWPKKLNEAFQRFNEADQERNKRYFEFLETKRKHYQK